MFCCDIMKLELAFVLPNPTLADNVKSNVFCTGISHVLKVRTWIHSKKLFTSIDVLLSDDTSDKPYPYLLSLTELLLSSFLY